jgi:hypothetical protein
MSHHYRLLSSSFAADLISTYHFGLFSPVMALAATVLAMLTSRVGISQQSMDFSFSTSGLMNPIFGSVPSGSTGRTVGGI